VKNEKYVSLPRRVNVGYVTTDEFQLYSAAVVGTRLIKSQMVDSIRLSRHIDYYLLQ